MEWKPIFHDFTFGEPERREMDREGHIAIPACRQMRDGYPRNTKNAAFAAPRDCCIFTNQKGKT